ncbi:hypothetical protein [Streptomyces sp. NPDC058424]|uniref:hypothetical protein n=1 Tax=Streptomyces sp. NPDC058424 TaxID=3346491 RepID=UPI003647B90F
MGCHALVEVCQVDERGKDSDEEISEGAHEELVQRPAQKEFPATLQVENDGLLASYEDLELSVSPVDLLADYWRSGG